MARIRVRVKSTGQTGSIEERDFNPTMFEKVGGAAEKPTEEPAGKLKSLLRDFVYSEKKAPIAESLEEKEGLIPRTVGRAVKPLEAGLRYMGGSAYMGGASLAGLLGSKGGQELTLTGNIPYLTKEQEEAYRAESPLPAAAGSAKAGAGLAAYTFPPAQGKMAALTGFLRGGLSKASEPEVTPGEVVGSAVTSSATELILANLVPYFKKVGGKLTTRAGIKRLGKPTLSEGGIPSVERWGDLGLDITALDKLGASADDIIKTDGGKLLTMISDASDEGAEVGVAELQQYLNSLLSDAKTPEMKAPILNALESLSKTYGDDVTVPLKEFYKIKQNWGKQGRWSELTPPKDTAKAKIFNKLFSKADEIIESRLGEQGKVFRELNAKITASFDAQHFVKRIKLTTTPGGLPAGFNASLKTLFDNPAVLQALGGAASKISETPPPLADFLTKGAGIASYGEQEGYKY